jgi:DNA-binding response OmpR family regulator
MRGENGYEAELLARIEALLRRTNKSNENNITFKGLTWNEASMEIKYRNHNISMTPTTKKT